VFAILANDELVGACGFLEIGGTPKRAELGYWIGQPFWGRGYATEGVRLVLDYGLTELRLDRVVACHITTNRASGRVLEKAGFRLSHEGPATRGEKWGPEDVFVHYELLSGER
jgi:RimJ/RimL family protein N-acetyltransferase